MSMDKFRHDTINSYGPQPTTPQDALAHVLCAYAQEPDDRLMIQATSGIYGDGVTTGLTMGDLRALQQKLDAIEQPTNAAVVQLPKR